MKLEKFKREDPKKKIITLGSIIVVLLITIIVLYRSFAYFENIQEFDVIKGIVPEQNYDIMISLTKEDENGNKTAIEYIPEKNEEQKYEVSVVCNNEATGVWNYDEWKPEINDFTTTRTKCTINFKENNDFEYPVSGKRLIAEALTEKGIETSMEETFETMAENIKNFKEATDLSEITIVSLKVMGIWTYGTQTISYTAKEDCVTVSFITTAITPGTSSTRRASVSSGTILFSQNIGGAQTIIAKTKLKAGETVSASAISTDGAYFGYLAIVKV